jgi:hypothetical protein
LSIPPKPLTTPATTFCFWFLGFIRHTYCPMHNYKYKPNHCHEWKKLKQD